MTCLYCGQEFNGKRADAKFCCASHRVLYCRKRKQHVLTDKRKQDVLTDNETHTITAAWFNHRPEPANLFRDYDDLRQALADCDRDALIQEIICYRADLDELREARQGDLLELRALRKALADDPYMLLKDYELIKVTSDVGTPQESTLKIIAPTPQTDTTHRRRHV